MQQGLKIINQIIERDAKSSTYKLALLRGIIDIVQNHGNLKKEVKYPKKGLPEKFQTHSFENYISYPFGLLLEKWIFYYFPLSDTIQTTGQSKRLNFQSELEGLVNYYGSPDAFNEFYLDYKRGINNENLKKLCFQLARKIRSTLKDQPMCYMGSTYCQGHYRVCFPDTTQTVNASRDLQQPVFDTSLLSGEYFGRFYIPAVINDVLEYLGAYLFGTSTILRKWIDETVRYQRNSDYQVSEQQIFEKLLPGEPIRLVREVREYILNHFINENPVHCVLSGQKLSRQEDIAIDHLIPFSIMGNNDLWNLLPSKSNLNLSKSDKIPAPEFLDTQKELILDYWNQYYHFFNTRFEREIIAALLPASTPTLNSNAAFENLKEKCGYLIDARGFEPLNSIFK